MNEISTKTYTSSYLFNKANTQYEKSIFTFIMNSERIDVKDESFEEILLDVKKRQIENWLYKILLSKNVVLLYNTLPMSKNFKVIPAKDVKEGTKDTKVFIDVSDIFKLVDGVWKCSNIDILIAYLVSASNAFIYYRDPKRILLKSPIAEEGAAIFSSLFTYIVDYIYKISTTADVRNKCVYLSSMYYLHSILGKDISDNTKAICRKLSGLSERGEELLFIQFDEECFVNINTFINELGKILRLSKLTIDVFVENWVYLYGIGTLFALELYPSFASMITNVYIGCYLNNQKTIEKIAGKRIVKFCNTILRIGGESV